MGGKVFSQLSSLYVALVFDWKPYLDLEERPGVRDFVDDRLGVLHQVVARDDTLVTVQIGGHSLLK